MRRNVEHTNKASFLLRIQLLHIIYCLSGRTFSQLHSPHGIMKMQYLVVRVSDKGRSLIVSSYIILVTSLNMKDIIN